MSSQASAPGSKRPKLHPLRQTSFPANSEQAYASAVASARSETGSMAPSTFSTTSTTKAPPRGRGRPRKSLQVTEEDAQNARDTTNASTTGGGRNKNTTSKSIISAARSGAAAAADDEDEEDEDDEVQDHDDDENEKDTLQGEADRINTFLGQLNEEQMNRYQNYRSSTLKTSVIRRIVNQTVSQSVGKSQIDAVQFFSKAFAIEVIERAREVQTEWAEVKDVEVEKERKARKQRARDKEQELEDKQRQVDEKQKELEEKQTESQEKEKQMREVAASTDATPQPSTADGTEQAQSPAPTSATLDAERKTIFQVLTTLRQEITKLRNEVLPGLQKELLKLKADADRYIPNKHHGGLLPDHLREALRRYKADGEGGGFGFDGMSHPLLGIPGAMAWRVGDGGVGQRLFR